MKRRFFAFALVTVLALCALTAVRLALSPPAPVPSPSPAPALAPVEEEPFALAFLGDGSDPWCAPLFEELADWAKEKGWRLVTYDCRGSATVRQGQVEDLLRTETVQAALLYVPVETERAASQRELLDKAQVKTLTLTPWGGTDIGPAEGLGVALENQAGRDVLLVVDVPEEDATQAALDALGRASLNVVEYGSCWRESRYAREYVSGALERHPYVGAILCLGREGAWGAVEALEDVGGRREIAVLCLDQSQAAREDLALGRMDGVLEVSREGVLAGVEAILAGKSPEPLPVILHKD